MFNWCVNTGIKPRSINFLVNGFMLKNTAKYISGSSLFKIGIQTIYQNRGVATHNVIQESNELNKVSIKGWIKDVQISEKCIIISINEGLSSNNTKVVLSKSLFSNKIAVGAPVSIIGKNDNKKGMVLATAVKVKGNCFSKKEFIHGKKSTFDEIDDKHLLHPRYRSRFDFFNSRFRYRSKLKTLLHDFFQERNYIEIDTPILTRYLRDGEEKTFYLETYAKISKRYGYTNPVDVFFGHPVYLSTCRRFHLQCALSGLNKVYSMGPLFRSGASSGKAIFEFWRADCEEIFFNHKNEAFEELLIRLEDLIKKILNTCLDEWRQDGKLNENALMLIKMVLEKEWIKLTYDEALSIVEAPKNEVFNINMYGRPLYRRFQTTLFKTFDNCPIFITDFPYYSKAFNVALNDKEADKVLAFELILPHVGVMASGSVKENDHLLLQERLQEYDAQEYYSWYTDMSKWGMAPTMGFSLGIEKLLYFIFKDNNIKNSIPFPRATRSCEC